MIAMYELVVWRRDDDAKRIDPLLAPTGCGCVVYVVYIIRNYQQLGVMSLTCQDWSLPLSL